MTFAPDHKGVRVVPSPNHDARTTPIDILLLHYTGMRTAEAALRAPHRCRRESVVALSGLRGRPHRSARRGNAARLARGRRVVEGRDRYQLAFDRDRDRQSGPRFRLSRLSRRADRCRDRALPRCRGAPSHREGTRARRIPMSRPRASRIRAKNSPGRALPPPASDCGWSRHRSPKAGRSASTIAAPPSPSSSACSPASVTPRTSRIATTRRPAR